jgi:hypothetical protein
MSKFAISKGSEINQNIDHNIKIKISTGQHKINNIKESIKKDKIFIIALISY